MLDLGLDVLFKGKNMARLLGGLGVALKISAVSVIISLPLGILLGVLMTSRNPIIKAILRLYLEFVRIMPQMVLLFLVYFGTTRAFGWNLSGETASIIVFVLWGTAEMSDLVRGALIAIPKHQYESAEALGMSRAQTYGAPPDPAVHQPDYPHDQDHQPCADDRCGGSDQGGTGPWHESTCLCKDTESR